MISHCLEDEIYTLPQPRGTGHMDLTHLSHIISSCLLLLASDTDPSQFLDDTPTSWLPKNQLAVHGALGTLGAWLLLIDLDVSVPYPESLPSPPFLRRL